MGFVRSTAVGYAGFMVWSGQGNNGVQCESRGINSQKWLLRWVVCNDCSGAKVTDGKIGKIFRRISSRFLRVLGRSWCFLRKWGLFLRVLVTSKLADRHYCADCSATNQMVTKEVLAEALASKKSDNCLDPAGAVS